MCFWIFHCHEEYKTTLYCSKVLCILQLNQLSWILQSNDRATVQSLCQTKTPPHISKILSRGWVENHCFLLIEPLISNQVSSCPELAWWYFPASTVATCGHKTKFWANEYGSTVSSLFYKKKLCPPPLFHWFEWKQKSKEAKDTWAPDPMAVLVVAEPADISSYMSLWFYFWHQLQLLWTVPQELWQCPVPRMFRTSPLSAMWLVLGLEHLLSQYTSNWEVQKCSYPQRKLPTNREWEMLDELSCFCLLSRLS